jgi:hypothetical protein
MIAPWAKWTGLVVAVVIHVVVYLVPGDWGKPIATDLVKARDDDGGAPEVEDDDDADPMPAICQLRTASLVPGTPYDEKQTKILKVTEDPARLVDAVRRYRGQFVLLGDEGQIVAAVDTTAAGFFVENGRLDFPGYSRLARMVCNPDLIERARQAAHRATGALAYLLSVEVYEEFRGIQEWAATRAGVGPDEVAAYYGAYDPGHHYALVIHRLLLTDGSMVEVR